MVGHEIEVQGVDLTGVENKKPVILQMNDDDFPARFLQDLASQCQPQISSAAVLNSQLHPSISARAAHVERGHRCGFELPLLAAGSPRLDPRRIASAGIA